jgi:hypothetical protein
MSSKIITIFDKHEDFIELQYNSIVKHVKGEYEYIIFNNASTQTQADKNQQQCDKLGIKCIRIVVDYGGSPSNIAGSALNTSFKYLGGEKVFKIDSDMFFISDINISDLLVDDLVYIPNYQPSMEIMWSGVFGINLSKVDINLNFNPGVIPKTDTFGQSCLLTKDLKYSKKLIELYGVQDFVDGTLVTSLNNDCGVFFKGGDVTGIEKPEFYSDVNLDGLFSKYDGIINKLRECGFPEPLMVDIITLDEVDFMIHFKSANWTKYEGNYLENKKIAMKKLLTNSID